jgi:hypothetical protein
MGDRPTVFISYARADEGWKNRLVKHLLVLERQGILQVWDDRRIRAGENWREEIRAAMDQASIAVLLVTVNFLNSDFIHENELPKLLDQRKKKGLTVVPVLIKPCAWRGFQWLEAIQMRPGGERAISGGSAHQIEKDFAAITEEIRRLARAAQMQTTAKLAQQRGPEGASRGRLSAKLSAIVLALVVGGTIIINSLLDSSIPTLSINDGGTEDASIVDATNFASSSPEPSESLASSSPEPSESSASSSPEPSESSASQNNKCLPPKRPCKEDKDCCYQFCCKGLCENPTVKKRNSESCKRGEECCSGCCNKKTLTCDPAGIKQKGESCDPGDCCESGYCCPRRCVLSAETKQENEPCKNGYECCSGYCCGGTCNPIKKPCSG